VPAYSSYDDYPKSGIVPVPSLKALAGAFKKRKMAPKKMVKRSKRAGAALERYVGSILDGDLTRNSGAQDLDGDLRVNFTDPEITIGNISIECKRTEKPGNYIIKRDVIDQHQKDCLKKGLVPVWAIQRAAQPVVCAMSLDTLRLMLSAIKTMAREIRRLRVYEERS